MELAIRSHMAHPQFSNLTRAPGRWSLVAFTARLSVV
jgi:hypothetical protein